MSFKDNLVSLWSQLWPSAMRFPWVMLVALTGTIFLIIVAHDRPEDLVYGPEWILRLLIICGLAIAPLIGMQLLGERLGWTFGRRALLAVAVMAYPVGVGLTLNFDVSAVTVIRLVLYFIAGHAFIAAVPFLGRHLGAGFWQFNVRLFVRFWSLALVALLLIAGFAGLMLLVDFLFEFDILEHAVWPMVYIVLAFVATWVLLALMPAKIDDLEETYEYPKFLRGLVLYILIPMVLAYCSVLITYCIYVTVIQSWPEGLFTWMILSVATVGTFVLMLAHPLAFTERRMLARFYVRWFPVFFLPLLIVQFIAIGVRIDAYGFTIDRVMVLNTSVWLGVLSIIWMISRGRAARFVPVSLMALVVLTTLGPVSAFSLTQHSQIERLQAKLTELGHMENGRLIKVLGEDERIEGVSSMVVEIDASGGRQRLIDMLPEEHDLDLEAIQTTPMRFWGSRSNELRAAFGGRRFYGKPRADGLTVSQSDREFTNVPLPVRGYDYLTEVNIWSSSNAQNHKIVGPLLHVCFDTVVCEDIDVAPFVKSVIDRFGPISAGHRRENVDFAELILTGKTNRVRYKMEVSSLTILRHAGGEPELQSIKGTMLFSHLSTD